jgi:hypothetical protein
MSKDEVAITLSITPTWSILKEVQEKTEQFMKNKNAKGEYIDATVMCASELVENAIKYGSSISDQNLITFELSTGDGRICIKVTNGIKDEKDVRNVKIHIDRLKKTKDPGLLYTERLRELMDNPKPGASQLGLYRIAYEGEFRLDYQYQNRVLKVKAERNYR